MDGATVTWPPSRRGGNPGGHAPNVAVCSKVSEMTGGPGSFPSSWDAGSHPSSLLLSTEGASLRCLRSHGARDFSSLSNFSCYF